MTKHILFLFCCLFLPIMANAADVDNPNIKTAEEILAEYTNNASTDCSSKIFSDALIKHSNEISQDTDENKVRAWTRVTMGHEDVLEQILNCPEIKSTPDDQTIIFTPIIYKFENGRTITINYSTQPRVLKQKLVLARKPSLPNGDPNPKLMDPNDPAKYLSTEPSWYGIMVVQHDSLKDFVGKDKNNTLSLKYISDHIEDIYPHGYYCTSKSAIANDNDTINQVVHEVVNMDEEDKNDYYVAGDVNLEWIMYAEIAADVAITILTWGSGEAALIGVRGLRATKASKNLIKSMKALSKLDDVADYIKILGKISNHTDDIAKLSKNIGHADDYVKLLKNAEKAKSLGKFDNAAKFEKQAKEVFEAAKKVDPSITENALKNVDKLKNSKKELEESLKGLKKAEETAIKNSKNVKQYSEQYKALSDVMKYRRELRGMLRPQTGNVITRNLKGIFKTLKTAEGGAKKLNKASRLARAGMSSRSARIKDWLVHSALKHGARLAKFERNVGALAGVVGFLGDLWDRTSSTSKEFSNGIEFKPLCLLSADDLAGQENVVNYGMWLMWTGNSTDNADDDSAYLQAMDFASKFYYKLDEFQDEHVANCNVDIYVVHPIIRLDESNTTDPKGEMFYLFMNEIPWTTAEQFGEQIKDVEDWERNQTKLYESDPAFKYHKREQKESGEQQNNTENNESTQNTENNE